MLSFVIPRTRRRLGARKPTHRPTECLAMAVHNAQLCLFATAVGWERASPRMTDRMPSDGRAQCLALSFRDRGRLGARKPTHARPMPRIAMHNAQLCHFMTAP